MGWELGQHWGFFTARSNSGDGGAACGEAGELPPRCACGCPDIDLNLAKASETSQGPVNLSEPAFNPYKCLKTCIGEIIGGQEAKPHSRPYMACLATQRRGDTYICGGFLVSKNFVLTAAHCNGDEITVTLGAHNIREPEQSQQKISVRHRIPHPQYNKTTWNNDIMLLQLAERAKLNRWVGTIALPRTSKRVKPGAVCSVAGWGGTSTDGKSSPARLQEVDVVVMPDAACSRKPNGSYYKYKSSTMMCVGDPKMGKDSWKGDSGGPLVCGKTAQGVVSWGPPTPPGVYVKVSTFIPWIRATMRRLQP
ncbi:granzyme H-like [Mauremys mutica]|uniref:granzyme H-like n=1 Tax=Mauremys mutica TaxID=74926 RepID=UPI001D16C7EC|nr:granzyme H-like [Mauremys mutica]